MLKFDMFKNTTMLDSDFLKNEFGYELYAEPKMQQALFKDCYINICAYISENNVLVKSPKQIEAVLGDDENYKYIFRCAQAKQLMYDAECGRGSMIRGEDGSFDICRDTVSRLKLINLIKHAAILW